jgi:hypothetical protein
MLRTYDLLICAIGSIKPKIDVKIFCSTNKMIIAMMRILV